MDQPTLSLPSFAKINLSLRILGKRVDGYHEVNTILQTISLHDYLRFEIVDDGSITLVCDEPEIPLGDENLVVRAANALREAFQIKHGARIQLQKRIPTKGGLGGASSNAAVTLLGLVHLWNIQASAAELLRIAASLGSDVPFFLRGGCAFATGTGSDIETLPDGGNKYLIVVTPSVGISTLDAYAAFSARVLTRSGSAPILSSSREGQKFRRSNPWSLKDGLVNDFEPVIFDIEPEIKRAKELLLSQRADAVLLAGSGSSVFGIFADQKAQQRASEEIRIESGWRLFSCVTVTRTDYLRALDSCGSEFLRSFDSESDIGA